jgi:hypothetical protein
VTIAELGALGEFVGSITVIITLIYLAVQVRQNTAQQRSNAIVNIQSGQNELVKQMADPSVTRAYALAAEGGTSVSIEDKARAIMWVIQYINHFEIVFDAYQNKQLPKEKYDVWEGFAVAIVASKGIRDWWNNEGGMQAFLPGVRDVIDKKLRSESEPVLPFNEMWTILQGQAWK